MSTLATYHASLLLKGYDAVASATIDGAIQEARRRVFLARRWSWLEASSTSLATVAGTATVSLAAITDLAHIDAVRLSDAGTPLKIDWKPWQEIRDLQDRCGTTAWTGSCTRYWSRRGTNLVFFPTPARVYTVTVEYAKAAADLTGATVDAIPDKNQDLVIWAACVPLAFRQRQLGESSAADQFFTKVLLPQAAGQDAVEQRQTSEQIKQGYWSY